MTRPRFCDWCGDTEQSLIAVDRPGGFLDWYCEDCMEKRAQDEELEAAE